MPGIVGILPPSDTKAAPLCGGDGLSAKESETESTSGLGHSASATRQPSKINGFCTQKTYYPCPGAKFSPGPRLTSSEDILARLAEVTAAGYWSLSPAATLSYDIYVKLAEAAAERARLGLPAIGTIADIPSLLQEPGLPGLGITPEIQALRDDLLIDIEAGDAVILGAPDSTRKYRSTKADGYLGWEHGDPKGVRRDSVEEGVNRTCRFVKALLSDGLPAKFFPKDVMAEFEAARQRGEVQLPRWAMEAAYNNWIGPEVHPVTGQTVMNRIKALIESGEMACTRAPRTSLISGRWRTVSGVYAMAREGVKTVVRASRDFYQRLSDRACPDSNRAWRELRRRWKYRDRLSGWSAW